MPPELPKSRSRRLLKWFAIVLGGLALLIVVAAGILRHYSTRYSLDRAWVEKALEKRYGASVSLKEFSATFHPSININGAGLALSRKDEPGQPPFASIAKFSISAAWAGVLLHPPRFQEVRLDGLVLNIPPHRNPPNPGVEPGKKPGKKPKKKKSDVPTFVLEHVVADGTMLNILSANPNKPPHVFQIQKLRLQSAGVGRAMSFQADLTNPVPAGQIHSKGRFGPWNADDPAQTPVGGNYTFSDADLSTIRGLRGILSSQGKYDGVLGKINVKGETDTPDFGLDVSGNKVDLKTEFNAIVDGTSGDTFLQPVTAHLLQSTIVARGGVARVSGSTGKAISLDVTANPARLEDLLRLAVTSPTPVMTGAVTVQTKLDIRPGKEDILQRMTLDGSFNINSGHFTNQEVQEKLTGLSRLGQGKRGDQDIKNAPISMQGQFAFANGMAKFSKLTFGVPGASIELHGTFGVEEQTLNFEGTARLEAKVSQLTTGFKSVLLRAVDPLFERNGAGTVVPIRIEGTRKNPSIKIEFGKIFGRSK
jgi:hypothetical protein